MVISVKVIGAIVVIVVLVLFYTYLIKRRRRVKRANQTSDLGDVPFRDVLIEGTGPTKSIFKSRHRND